MIRLVGRRLIIPQGDTGTFTIPTQGTVSQGDVAVFSIFDLLTQEVKLEKEINATAETLTFNFTSEDTLNIEPDDRGNRYVWDITIKRSPVQENNTITYGTIDSYYAAFGLPACVIKRVTRNV